MCFTAHLKTFRNLNHFCEPFFSNKTTNFDCKIILVEKEKEISRNEVIATHLNNYFNYTSKRLNMVCLKEIAYNDPLVNATEKYKNRSSIFKMKSSFKTTQLR